MHFKSHNPKNRFSGETSEQSLRVAPGTTANFVPEPPTTHYIDGGTAGGDNRVEALAPATVRRFAAALYDLGLTDQVGGAEWIHPAGGGVGFSDLTAVQFDRFILRLEALAGGEPTPCPEKAQPESERYIQLTLF